ncbi:TetR/AcrR family transcriptional regulator [Bifidobacterium xylocopae]|uniref:TetR family transcriptional regulator n=1 Tax=Bifidobacterium xylocopae TaxID=2493119 RepID=A0A366KCJ2_9BIFI|nr:TetR/AcrR family transcriptional regulator [Bifidobacterium xylocopae]RBP99456.1 TetR family transcriptional regulator [Bifidobacterium xylocopae]
MSMSSKGRRPPIHTGAAGRPINHHERLAPQKRRARIAKEAARLIARYGSYGVSMQAIADAVGLTLPGLYHYVRNREELLSLIIETYYDDGAFSFESSLPPEELRGLEVGRDEQGRKLYSLPRYLNGIVKRNAQRMELVMLFMRLAVEAHDPQHPAYGYYRGRHAKMIGFMDGIRWKLPDGYRGQEAFHGLVRTAYCAMDGVQVQALTNPDDGIIELWAKADRVLFPSPEWDGCR